MFKKTDILEKAIIKAQETNDSIEKKAAVYRDKVFVAQADLRKTVDTLEEITSADYWPIPSYAEMLFLL
jgi:glutamine synthetase